MIYKGYILDEKPNEWGYFEAYHIKDCDRVMLKAKTLKELKTDIDEL